MKHRLTKEEKFDKIYESYADDIYKVCLHYLKDKELAKEIMQQTFLEFYDYFENVEQEYTRAYLIHTAKDLIDNQLKISKEDGEVI